MVALQELSKDLGLFVFYSRVGTLKAIRRHTACPKGLTQLLLTLSFLHSYSSHVHGKSTHRLYFTVPLRGNTCSGFFQSVCLTQEKSIARSHRKYISFSSQQSVSPRCRGHSALQEANMRDMLPIPVLRPQGKNNALCGVNEQHQKGHKHRRCFWDVDSWCIRLLRTGSPISRAALPSPVQRYFHHLITSHFEHGKWTSH